MPKKGSKFIFLGAVAFLATLAGIFLFSPKKYFTTTPPTQPTTNLDSNAPTPATFHSMSARLTSAQTTTDLVAILRRLFSENESLAIKAFASLDSNSSVLQDSFEITEFFREYFAERYTALESLNRIAQWREKKPLFFKFAGVELLSFHSSEDDPLSIVNFLKEEKNFEILDLVSETVGSQLAINDPNGALDLVEQFPSAESRNLFREGVFGQWMIDDPNAVAQRLNSSELDASYDNILERFVLRAENDSKETYLEWANLIQDESLRTSSLLSLAKRWFQDPQFNESYLNWKSSLPETDADLLAQITQYEEEFSQRESIKTLFNDLFSEVREASVNENPARYNNAVNNLADSMRILMNQIAADPTDLVVRQELDTVHQQISNDYRASGTLPPTLEAVLIEYAEAHQEQFPSE